MFGLMFGASLPTRSWATNDLQNEVKAKEARKVIVTKRRIIFGWFSSWSKTQYFLWFELCFPTQVKQNYRKIRLSEAAHSRETFDARKGINHTLSWENQCTSLWTPSRIRFHFSLNMLTKSWVNGLWPATYFYLYRVKQPKNKWILNEGHEWYFSLTNLVHWYVWNQSSHNDLWLFDLRKALILWNLNNRSSIYA